MCMASESCKLQERVDAIDHRVTRLEENMASGFSAVTSAINDLGHDFGERMNLIEKKVVDEKTEWGKTLRKIVLWSAATLLSGAAVAMGVTIWNNFMVK